MTKVHVGDTYISDDIARANRSKYNAYISIDNRGDIAMFLTVDNLIHIVDVSRLEYTLFTDKYIYPIDSSKFKSQGKKEESTNEQ